MLSSPEAEGFKSRSQWIIVLDLLSVRAGNIKEFMVYYLIALSSRHVVLLLQIQVFSGFMASYIYLLVDFAFNF